MSLGKTGPRLGLWHLWMAMCLYAGIAIPLSIAGFIIAIMTDAGRLAGACGVLIFTGVVSGIIAVSWGTDRKTAPMKPPPPKRLGRAGRKQVRRIHKAERLANTDLLRARADLMLAQKVISPDEREET